MDRGLAGGAKELGSPAPNEVRARSSACSSSCAAEGREAQSGVVLRGVATRADCGVVTPRVDCGVAIRGECGVAMRGDLKNKLACGQCCGVTLVGESNGCTRRRPDPSALETNERGARGYAVRRRERVKGVKEARGASDERGNAGVWRVRGRLR